MSLAEKQVEECRSHLEKVVSNHFFRKYEARRLPTFDKAELGVGPRLGLGGFSSVCEIECFKLDPKNQDNGSEEEAKDNDTSSQPPAQQDACEPTYLGSFHFEGENLDGPDNAGHHNQHYNMKPREARSFMAENALREGDARYAIKKLRWDLDEEETVRGVMDLAIEAKFLAVISHPNIIKMRGMAATDILRSDFFLVLDRLYYNLEEKIEDWSDQYKSFAGCCGCIGTDKNRLTDLMLERLVALYDVSKAMAYLHEHNIIYRDIKPENIGQDVRGDVKLFDFGLAKVLRKRDKCEDGTYKLTGLTGSCGYMAPEVASCKTYNLTADTFSFATLAWQVLSLEVPFESNQPREYIKQVCEQDYRPAIPSSWSPFLRHLVNDSWKKKPEERPDFFRTCNVLKGEMNHLADSSRDSIHQRSTHMMDRSVRSNRNLTRSIRAETEGVVDSDEDAPTSQ